MRKTIILILILGGLYFGIRYLNSVDFENFLDSHPEWEWVPAFDYYMGQFYVIFSHWDKAMYKFKRIAKNYPSDRNWAPKAQFALAKVYDDTDRYKEAVVEYQKLIDLYPESKDCDFAEKRIQILKR